MKTSFKSFKMNMLTNKNQNRSEIKRKNPKKKISSILTYLEVSTIYLRIFGSEEGMKQNCYFLYKSKDKTRGTT